MRAELYLQVKCPACGLVMTLVITGQVPYLKCSDPTCPNGQKRFEPPTVELKEL